MAPEEAPSQFPWLPGLTVTSPAISNDWLPEKEGQRGPQCLSEKSRYFQPEALYSSQHKKEHSEKRFWLECIFSRRLHAAAFHLIGKNGACAQKKTLYGHGLLLIFLIFDAHGQAKPVNPVVLNCGKYLKNVTVY